MPVFEGLRQQRKVMSSEVLDNVISDSGRSSAQDINVENNDVAREVVRLNGRNDQREGAFPQVVLKK